MKGGEKANTDNSRSRAVKKIEGMIKKQSGTTRLIMMKRQIRLKTEDTKRKR